MFRGNKKESKATASLAGFFKLKKNGKHKPKANGFSALQEADPEAEDQVIAKGTEVLTSSDSNGSVVATKRSGPETTNSATCQPVDVVKVDDADWTVVKERTQTRQPTELAPSTAANATAAATHAPWLTSRNWREPDHQANRDRYANATTVGTRRRKSTYIPGPRTRSGVLHADQKLGSIIWRLDVRPFQSYTVPDTDDRIVYQNGVRFLKKGRYWLVLKSTEKRVWEAPIYTNNDTGLKNKAKNTWHEYFALRPKEVELDDYINGSDYARDFVEQSSANKVLQIGWMADEVDEHKSMKLRKMRLTMVVHFAEIKVRSINQDDVVLVGALTDDDKPLAFEKARPYVNMQL